MKVLYGILTGDHDTLNVDTLTFGTLIGHFAAVVWEMSYLVVLGIEDCRDLPALVAPTTTSNQETQEWMTVRPQHQPRLRRALALFIFATRLRPVYYQSKADFLRRSLNFTTTCLSLLCWLTADVRYALLRNQSRPAARVANGLPFAFATRFGMNGKRGSFQLLFAPENTLPSHFPFFESPIFFALSNSTTVMTT